MSFLHRTTEERAAAAALKAERERLYIAKAQAKTARTALRANRVAAKLRVTEAKARRATARLQRSEEREEARYVTAIDRLERDRQKGRARPVRVRGSSRTRKYRRSRPRR